MTAGIRRLTLAAALVVAPVLFALHACSSGETYTQKSFVGKWKSSRATTPLYLHANGEWEIKTDEGSVLQYGVWQLKNGSILWSFKVGTGVAHDVNPVSSVTARQFTLRESDGSTTTFTRLE